MQDLTATMPQDIAKHLSLSLLRQNSSDYLSHHISEFLRWNNDRINNASKSGALRWISEDRMVKHAFKSASPRKKQNNSTSDILNNVCSRALIKIKKHHTQEHAVIDDLNSLADSSATWLLSLVCSLHEYHHDTTSVASASTRERHLIALKKKAIEGAAAFSEIRRLAAASLYSRASSYDINKLHEREIHDIDRYWNFSMRSLHPIRRNDATARERLFIYRLWQANMGMFRIPKVRSIQYLLLMDGIENQIDERNVSKMCSAFSEKYVGLTHSYTWRLFRHIRGNNCRGFNEG